MMKKKLLDFDMENLDGIHRSTINGLQEVSKRDIAIIGISCKFPDADNVDEFWDNIKNGRDCVREFPENRRKDTDNFLKFINVDSEKIKYARKAYISEIDKFNYEFFRISPKEACLMDPNQRLFLQTAWESIEDAGYGGKKLVGSKTGVYVGFSGETPYKRFVAEVDPASAAIALPGNLEPIIASRISYLLDLKGPSMLVDTACSSALVAVYLACQEIRNSSCEMAIAGSISLSLMPIENNSGELGIASPDGITRTFDDSSSGSGFGEGLAAVLLKPLSKALQDGDNIYAVIKGCATNQDGSSIGITAPNSAAQEEVIISAWEDAGIDPETVTLIEAHGTGTKLGDPIEISGIRRAFERYTNKKQFCAVGSVKTNIGHLGTAAGLAGLIKAVMALKHRQIPPSIHFVSPNKKINFKTSPVYVNDILCDWETNGHPRRCGVSAFGLSGTNCHIILEEAPVYKHNYVEKERPYILVLSAKKLEVLKEIINRYKLYLDNERYLDLANLCFTANTSRTQFEHRIALIIKNEEDLRTKINILYNNFPELDNLSNIGKEIFYGKYERMSKEKAQIKDFEITMEISNSLQEEAKNLIYKALEKYDEDSLISICDVYIKGADVNWDALFSSIRKRSLRLPVYPFEKSRCWIEIPQKDSKHHIANEKHMYYEIDWEKKETDAVYEPNTSGLVMIFKDEKGMGTRIAARLRAEGTEVIEIELGAEFKKVNSNKYIIQGEKDDYIKLIDEVSSRNLTKIIHLMSISSNVHINSICRLKETQKSGVYSLLFLSKAILGKIEKDVQILLVSEFVNKVSGKEEEIKPENASLFGLGKVIGLESSKLVCRCIDIDNSVDENEILIELKAENGEYHAAYRNKSRYIEVMQRSDIQSLSEREAGIEDGGVYVITGGTGGLGIEIAKYLAFKSKVKLCLISRSSIPEKNVWHSILKDGEQKQKKKVRSIMEIEALGSEVICYSADVSIESQMKNVFNNIKARYGKINGIVHCAGVVGEGFIMGKGEELFDAALAPKVYGTWLLDKLTENDELDFFVLFSSASTLINAPGQGAYIAANSYLDSFAEYRSMKTKRTLAINWAGWKDTGMAVDFGVNKDGIFKAIPNDIAINAFDYVMNRDISRVLIGEINYDNDQINGDIIVPFKLSKEIMSEIEKKSKNLKENNPGNNRIQLDEVALEGRENNEYTELEKMVASIYGSVLGFNKLSVYANFYELGGDSIFAIRVINNINIKMAIRMEITEIFKNPTIASLAAWLKGKCIDDKDSNTYSSIQPVVNREYYPVSSAQKRMLILNQLEDPNTSYNLLMAMVSENRLDKELFERTVRELVKRHESLRTSFTFIDGVPMQKIHPDVNFEIMYIDEEINDADELIQNFIQYFELNKVPIFRAGLANYKNGKSVLMFDMHHIISDGTSVGILAQEFIKLYSGQSLRPLRLQYKDYSEWQNSMFKTEAMMRQEEYWLQEFRGILPVLDIPTDYPRPKIRCIEGDTVSFELGIELFNKLKSFATQQQVTTYTLLLTAFNLLLYKYTGQEDLIIGTPIEGRHHVDLSDIVGMFVNTLAIRSHPKGGKSVKEFLSEVKSKLLKAFENQDYQFEEIINKLKIPRRQDRNPLFDVEFVMQNVNAPQVEIEGLTFTPYSVKNKTSKFDITLLALESKDNIGICIEYCTKLFRKETINKLSEHYKKILDIISSNRDIKIMDIVLEESLKPSNNHISIDMMELRF